jgi:hypothetical protein
VSIALQCGFDNIQPALRFQTGIALLLHRGETKQSASDNANDTYHNAKFEQREAMATARKDVRFFTVWQGTKHQFTQEAITILCVQLLNIALNILLAWVLLAISIMSLMACLALEYLGCECHGLLLSR